MAIISNTNELKEQSAHAINFEQTEQCRIPKVEVSVSGCLMKLKLTLFSFKPIIFFPKKARLSVKGFSASLQPTQNILDVQYILRDE